MPVVATRAVMGRVDMAHLTYEDAVAIHRAHQQGGDDAALAEVRRRWPDLVESVHREVIRRIMRLKIEVPKAPTHPGAAPSPGAVIIATGRTREQERNRKRAQRERERAGRE